MRIDRAKYFVVAMTAAGALCILALLVFLTRPTLNEVVKLADDLTAAETEMQAQYTNRKQLSDTVERLKAARATIAELSGQFVRPGEELTIITAIEAIGDNEGVQTHLTLDNSSGGIPDAKEFDRGFTMTLNGGYQAVLRALVDIERLNQITVIQSIAFRGGGAGPGQAVPVAVTLSGLFASPPKGL